MILVRTCGWRPRTPPHSYTRPSEKTWPIHILPISKIDPIHILFFKFYRFIYFLGEKDTPLIYFWCENDTHSYTWGLKSIPPSAATSVYTFIIEVNPPPPPPPPSWSPVTYNHDNDTLGYLCHPTACLSIRLSQPNIKNITDVHRIPKAQAHIYNSPAKTSY